MMKLSAALMIFCGLLLASTLADETPTTFLQGSVLRGGVNGMSFDANGDLWATRIWGFAISRLDPESGSILESVEWPKDQVFFPDDIVVGRNGTMYWTDWIMSTIFKREASGVSQPMYPFRSYYRANPIALPGNEENESRLFFAQCFHEDELGGIYERNLVTGETSAILDEIPACASNAFVIRDGYLYSPRPTENRVVRIDLVASKNNRTITDLSSLLSPFAVKMNSKGELYVASRGNIYRIPDLGNPSDPSTNLELVATSPLGQIDNIIFEPLTDRLYLSSLNRGSILEVLGEKDFREVVPGRFSNVNGMAVLNNTLHICGSNFIAGFDIWTAEEIYFHEPDGETGFNIPWTVLVIDHKVAYISTGAGTIQYWDTESQSVTETIKLIGIERPVDALSFQGGLLVTDSKKNVVTKVTGDAFDQIEDIASIPGGVYLAGNDEQVYVTSYISGEIFQIVSDGEILAKPLLISSGHKFPEGMALLDHQTLAVIATGSGNLELVDLKSGDVSVAASGLKFLSGVPAVLPYGFPNQVVVAENDVLLVNGDGTNTIYKIILDPRENGAAKEKIPKLNADSSVLGSLGNVVAIWIGLSIIALFW